MQPQLPSKSKTVIGEITDIITDTPDFYSCYEKIFTAIKHNQNSKSEIFDFLTEVSNDASLIHTQLKETEFNSYIREMQLRATTLSGLVSPEREFKLNLFSSKATVQTVPYTKVKSEILDKYFSGVLDYTKFSFKKNVNVAIIPFPKLDVNVANTSSAKLYYTFVIVIKSKDSILWLELPPIVYMTLHSLQRVLVDRSKDISSKELFDTLYNSSLLLGDLLCSNNSPHELVLPIGGGLAYGNKDTTTVNYAVYNYANVTNGKLHTLSGFLPEESQPMVVTTYVNRDIMNYKQIALANKLASVFNQHGETFNEDYLCLHNEFTNRFNAIRA